MSKRSPSPPQRPPVSEPGPVLGPPDVLRRANSEALRLATLERWAPAFVAASQEPPLLVRRLDKDDFYYLVSFRSGDGITARVRINAHTGKYAEAIGIDRRGDALAPYLTPERIRDRIARKPPAGSARTGQRAPIIEPFLGWKPCAQSFSAFLPFYVVRVGVTVLYYRVDGKVFTQLTAGAGL